MLGAMRGAVNVGAAFGRLRRHVHSGVVDTDSTPDVHIITPLEFFLRKHRNVKAHIPFSTLNPSCRKDFYGSVAEYYLERRDGEVTYIFSCRASRSTNRPRDHHLRPSSSAQVSLDLLIRASKAR